MGYKPAKVKLYKGFSEIKGLRQALGLTQADMAKILDCERSSYSHAEAGTRNYSRIYKKARDFLYGLYRRTRFDLNSLRVMRLRLGLTLKQAGELIGVTCGVYNYIERVGQSDKHLEQRARELFQTMINDLEAET